MNHQAAIAEARTFLAKFRPNNYSPEMTDDEVQAAFLECWEELRPIIDAIVGAIRSVWSQHIDDVMSEVDELLRKGRLV